MCRFAPFLAERMGAADVNRHPRPQVREGKGRLPVTAVGRAEQCEQRLILIDGQRLPVTEGPSLRREIEGHNSDFGEEGFGHGDLPD